MTLIFENNNEALEQVMPKIRDGSFKVDEKFKIQDAKTCIIIESNALTSACKLLDVETVEELLTKHHANPNFSVNCSNPLWTIPFNISFQDRKHHEHKDSCLLYGDTDLHDIFEIIELFKLHGFDFSSSKSKCWNLVHVEKFEDDSDFIMYTPHLFAEFMMKYFPELCCYNRYFGDEYGEFLGVNLSNDDIISIRCNPCSPRVTKYFYTGFSGLIARKEWDKVDYCLSLKANNFYNFGQGFYPEYPCSLSIDVKYILPFDALYNVCIRDAETPDFGKFLKYWQTLVAKGTDPKCEFPFVEHPPATLYLHKVLNKLYETSIKNADSPGLDALVYYNRLVKLGADPSEHITDGTNSICQVSDNLYGPDNYKGLAAFPKIFAAYLQTEEHVEDARAETPVVGAGVPVGYDGDFD